MKRWWLWFALICVAASAVDKGAEWSLAHLALTPTARIAVALAPLPGNLAIIAAILWRIRLLDEFKQRIHFEAVVVGFLGTGVAVFIHHFLFEAHVVAPLNAAWVWAFMGLSYAIGYAMAMRHYQ